MSIYNLILEILNEIEKHDTNVSIAGGKGYSVGKIYSNKTVGVLRNLGKEESKDIHQEYEIKPVKISKVFKKRKIKNGWWLPNRKIN